MTISVFNLFKIGIGPSSSHTVGPMVAAAQFVAALETDGDLGRVAKIRVALFGSLGATGRGHGTHKAVQLGLLGHAPDAVDPDAVPCLLEQIAVQGQLSLGGSHVIQFDPKIDLVFEVRKRLPYHPNAMRITATDSDGNRVCERAYYSIGGGFVVDEAQAEHGIIVGEDATLPLRFTTGAELLAHCEARGMGISDVMRWRGAWPQGATACSGPLLPARVRRRPQRPINHHGLGQPVGAGR